MQNEHSLPIADYFLFVVRDKARNYIFNGSIGPCYVVVRSWIM